MRSSRRTPDPGRYRAVRVQEVMPMTCLPGDVLEFVLDIERYAEVDDKIRPVLWARRAGDLVVFACRPRLAGLRQPAVVQVIERVSEHRLEISLCPAPCNRLANAVARFAASVDVHDDDGVTQVTRTLEFRFPPAVGWLLEPLFRRRLPGEVRDELERARDHLELRRDR